MLRITEIKLPLDHSEDALKSAILKKLQINPEELISYTTFKRSYDARKKTDIYLVYIVDVEIIEEQKLCDRFKKDPHVMLTPNMSYHYVAKLLAIWQIVLL